jgi:hypothetical protein
VDPTSCLLRTGFGLQILSLYGGLPEFCSLRKDLGLQILSLYTGLRCCFSLVDLVAIRRVPAHFIHFETTLDCRFCRCARFVAIRRVPVHSAKFEATLDCRFSRCTRDSGAFVLLRNDLGFQILLLYPGLWGIRLTSKRNSIADFDAIYGTPGHLASFGMTLDCRCCGYIRSPGEPRRAWESPGEPRRARRARESPGEPGKARESPGEHTRAHESPREPRRAQESPRKPRRIHESPGEPRRAFRARWGAPRQRFSA